MPIDVRHHQLIQIICACVKDACDLAETLHVCAVKVPAATSDDMRRALEHVGFFNMEEAERILPAWERHKSTPEFEETRKSFARAVEGLEDKT
jgi:hypothetical protein